MSTLPISRNFPTSTARPSRVCQLPVSPGSTAVLQRTLEANDRGYDIYGAARFAHNHFPHSALTRYALGAGPRLLDDTWAHDRRELVSLDPRAGDHKIDQDVVDALPEKIDADNWTAWLGQKDAYALYLAFFHAEIARLGSTGAVRHYLFDLSTAGGEDNMSGPRMLVRAFAGVVHPFIHIGFGLEFGDVVVLAEGLAQAAVHPADAYASLYPRAFPLTPLEPTARVHLLHLYADVLADPIFAPGPYAPDSLIGDKLAAALQGGTAAALRHAVARWGVREDEAADGFADRLQEVGWLVTLLACATTRPGYAPRIDFFLMHALTSSIFLPSYMAHLAPAQAKAVLDGYVLTILHVALARGRPALYIDHLMVAPEAGAGAGSSGRRDAISESETNPWLGIIDNSLLARDSHTPKAVRALLHYASLNGATAAGDVPGAKRDGRETLPGTARLDGSAFVRAARRVLDVTGWVGQGEHEGSWDRSALGWDGAWGDKGRL
ncbi:hypothetical protein Q5752_003277 [Cryptotrichosporon argae]